MENENVEVVSLKERLSTDFQYLPDYAAYLLRQEFNNFVDGLLRLYREADVPLFRFFKNVAEDEISSIVAVANREMLTLLASNQVRQYIDQTLDNWLKNQLPVITREQVHSHDITLVNFARAKAFRYFIPNYTDEMSIFRQLIDEIDRFFLILNSDLFAAYIQLQNAKIKSINAALEKREKQLLEAQEIGQIGSFEWDFDGKASYSPQMLKIIELSGASNLSSFLNNVHPDDQQKVRTALEKAMVDGDYRCDYRYVGGGKEKLIHSKGKVQFENGHPVRVIGTVTDETERHQIIQRLQESEKLNKQAQAITRIGNWSWSVHENKITWSDEMYRIYGLEPQSEEITYDRFISFIDPVDRPRRIAQIRKSLQTLKVDEYHFRIKTARGELKILRGKGEVIVDEHNKPLAMLGTCQDVTHEFMLTQQLRERERYLQELNRSLESANQELGRKNEELASFNFIASHDLQEPLRKIQIYSSRILEAGVSELSPTLQEYFGRMNMESKRMQKLIEDFLLFSQPAKPSQPREKIDLRAVIEEIKSELVTRIEDKKASIHVSSLPEIYGVPFQIKQLLINLVSNALKYTRDGVPPRIEISGGIVEGSDLTNPDAQPGTTYAMTAVSDNGIGFDPKYSAKIFELFQRLHSKNTFSGTGIGLALCKKILQSVNGFITAESVPGRGSVFTFYIPVEVPEG